MCLGISLSAREVTDAFIRYYRLSQRIVTRHPGADREIRFLLRDPHPQLPVFYQGRMTILPWGRAPQETSRTQKTRLPAGGWCPIESLKEGQWQHLKPEEVIIPATYGYEKGVWFLVKEGMRGVVILGDNRVPHVYMLTQPASHYYRIMTRHDRMPCLLGAEI
ncbi:Hypothetical protein PBC10988_2410 [Planctomycetales bacterium 10988]|nr:Hypothetical protein PBC10988_2410 [Planctomycetales bacterium 10988]